MHVLISENFQGRSILSMTGEQQVDTCQPGFLQAYGPVQPVPLKMTFRRFYPAVKYDNVKIRQSFPVPRDNIGMYESHKRPPVAF